MLYDPKWENTTTKPDVLSLESLIAWLEQQPRAKTYDYDNCKGKCLYGLYMHAHGFSWLESGGLGTYGSTPERSKFCDLVYAAVAHELPWTFGAALERARRFRDER